MRHIHIRDFDGECLKEEIDHKHLMTRMSSRCPSCRAQDKLNICTQVMYIDPYRALFPTLFDGTRLEPEYDFCDIDPWIETQPTQTMTADTQVLLEQALEEQSRGQSAVEITDEDAYEEFLAWMSRIEENGRSRS